MHETLRVKALQYRLHTYCMTTLHKMVDGVWQALAGDRVPQSWADLAYPSLRPLASWVPNLLERVAQLSE